MSCLSRSVLVALLLAAAAPVHAQTPTPAPTPVPSPTPTPAGDPVAPGGVEPQPSPPPPPPEATAPAPYSTLQPPTPIEPPPEEPQAPKKGPGRGDFDAGPRVRFPSGPDETGTYETYNWVALDLAGRYFLLDSVTANANIPIALIKPDRARVGDETRGPGRIGGLDLKLDALLPTSMMPKLPGLSYETQIGLQLRAAYMHEGAMLLSDRDFPLFVDGFKPGLGAGLITRIKASSLLELNLLPQLSWQAGSDGSHGGMQIPFDFTLKLGSVVKLALELGIYTGDGYAFRGSNGARYPIGASLDVKLGPIIAHVGAGFATLWTGPLYPTVGDSLYVDLNVKWAK